jgi:large subunit ribosomal protein L18
MITIQDKLEKKIRRKNRVRAKVEGTQNRPRLSVFRSNSGLFLQLIDDEKGVTIASADNKELPKALLKKSTKTEQSFELGKIIAQKALDKKISTIVFDRGGNKYHGRIKAVADGAREAGLVF